MIRFHSTTFALFVGLALLSGCDKKPAPTVLKTPTAVVGNGEIDPDRLNAQIDSRIGGLNTCVILQETQTGKELYRYGAAQACLAKLPPCGTFDIPNVLIGLDAGLITSTTLYKWDGTTQPFGVWQKDADLNRAFKLQVGWWFQRLATAIGHDRYVKALRHLNYGDHDPAGLSNGFWLGPQAGGFQTVTAGQQADFIRRFYAGTLPVSAAALSTVQGLTMDETRPVPGGGQAVITGRAASCGSVVDGSRRVGWWVGRIKTPKRDMVVAASVEATEAPPGIEIERRLEDIFADSGMIPAGDS